MKMLLSSNLYVFVFIWGHVVGQSDPIATPITMDIWKRMPPKPSSVEEYETWLYWHRQRLIEKYGGQSDTLGSRKREANASGYNDLVNFSSDVFYYGSIAVGTPAKAYNVLLDTGSSDLWLLSSSTCSSTSTSCLNYTYDPSPSSSSTYHNLSDPFQITYYSGEAKGNLASDVVRFAGFEVPSQTFAVVDEVAEGFLPDDKVSGLIGLGFQTLASSHAKPFWQALADSKLWKEPLMGIYLAGYAGLSTAQGKSELPGGRFTMGSTDATLYEGDIAYTDIPAGKESFWSIPVESLSVSVNHSEPISVDLGGRDVLAAIDTGTTFISASSDITDSLYRAITGSDPGDNEQNGSYAYQCNLNIEVSFTFSGKKYYIHPGDFWTGQILNGNKCAGSLVSFGPPNKNMPQFIIGDIFLKNIYTVLRYQPPSVGFANLSRTARALADVNGALPSTTITTAAVQTGGAKTRCIRTLLGFLPCFALLRLL